VDNNQHGQVGNEDFSLAPMRRPAMAMPQLDAIEDDNP
jgi:hypothetical protein